MVLSSWLGLHSDNDSLHLYVCTVEPVSPMEHVERLHYKDGGKALSLPTACAMFLHFHHHLLFCGLLHSFLISSCIPSIFDPVSVSIRASILVSDKTPPKDLSSNIFCISFRRDGTIFAMSPFKALMAARWATWGGIPVSLIAKLPSSKGTLTLTKCSLCQQCKEKRRLLLALQLGDHYNRYCW